MTKLNLNIPAAVLDLPERHRKTIAAELLKALRLSEPDDSEDDHDIWEIDSHPARAQLENAMYNELALATYNTMVQVFSALGLDTPLPLKKSLKSPGTIETTGMQWLGASGVPEDFIEKSMLRDTFGKFRPAAQRYAYNVADPKKWPEYFPSGYSMERVIYIPVNRLDTPYQTERATNPETVFKKRKLMHEGAELPPVIIGYDFDIHDGHHSWTAAKEEGHTHVPCIVGGTESEKVKAAEEYYRSMFKALDTGTERALNRRIPTEEEWQQLVVLIEQDLQGEHAAITQYEGHMKMIDDPLLQEIYEEIVKDEKHHVHNLNQAMYYVTGDPAVLIKRRLQKSILSTEGNLLYRGVGSGELDFILNNGYIQSKGAMNNEDQEGLTSYATTKEKAAKYAVDNLDLYGGKEAFVVALKRPQNAQDSPDTFEEATVRGKVPMNQIRGIWRLNEASVNDGADTFLGMFDYVGNPAKDKMPFAERLQVVRADETQTERFYRKLKDELSKSVFIEAEHPRDEIGRFTFKHSSYKEMLGDNEVTYHDIELPGKGMITVMENSPYAGGMHSVFKYFVEEEERGKGYGGQLADELIRHYGDEPISAQVSSVASLYALHNRGFRAFDAPELDDYDTMVKFKENGESLRMVRDTRKPYSPTDSQAFKNWFGNSKVVDADGKPLRLYHGTTHVFNAYDPDAFGNRENHMGVGFYATSDPDDVNKNYLHDGADLTNRITTRSERIESAIYEGDWYPDELAAALYPNLKDVQDLEAEVNDGVVHIKAGTFQQDIKVEDAAKQLAENELSGKAPNIMPVYMKIEHPVILDKKGGTRFYIEQEYDEENDEYSEETGNGLELHDAIYAIAPDYLNDESDTDSLWDTLVGDLDFTDGATAHDVMDAIKNSAEAMYVQDDETGEMTSAQFVQDVFRYMGYDGIMYKDAWQYFPNMVKRGTQHFIAFKPTQIKSATGNHGTYDPDDPDMRKSLWDATKHPRSSDGRFATKWGRAVQIGLNIQGIRRKYNADLKLDGMPRDKATALMIGLIDKGCFRIGNDESAEERGVFGLTTLTRDHIQVDGDTMYFDFIGKKGVRQQHTLTDKNLARVMKEMLKIEGGKKSGGHTDAGNSVFRYVNTQGDVRTPSQYVLNNYLDKWGITAKDFRTYHATRLVFEELEKRYSTRSTNEQRQKDVQEAVKIAAKKLGHQPKTCKRSYVDPGLIALYLKGRDIRKSFEDHSFGDSWQDYADIFWAWYKPLNDERDGEALEVQKALCTDINKDLFGKLLGNVRKKFRDRMKYSQNGRPFTETQLNMLEHIVSKYHVSPSQFAESFMTRAAVLGKLLGATEREDKKVVMAAFDSLPITIEATRRPMVLTARYLGEDKNSNVTILPLQSQERNALEWAKIHAGENLQNAQRELVHGVRQMVMQAKQERWEPSELASKLFDYFGSYNRDWRRIALTELAFAENNGYLMTLTPGDSVYIVESADCCKHCKSINVGKLLTYVAKPGNPATEVWVGKSNVGKKTRDWSPCVPLHPHCRGRYMRLNTTFYTMDETGKIILKTPEQIIKEKGIKRP